MYFSKPVDLSCPFSSVDGSRGELVSQNETEATLLHLIVVFSFLVAEKFEILCPLEGVFVSACILSLSKKVVRLSLEVQWGPSVCV